MVHLAGFSISSAIGSLNYRPTQQVIVSAGQDGLISCVQDFGSNSNPDGWTIANLFSRGSGATFSVPSVIQMEKETTETLMVVTHISANISVVLIDLAAPYTRSNSESWDPSVFIDRGYGLVYPDW